MLGSCGVLLTFSSRTVSALSHSLNVPVSAKLRLCQNIPSTHDLGARIEAAGASWLTLHARHVSARRRRQGAADLSQIKELKSRVGVPVVSNGNVKTWEDVVANRAQTGADGVMVGETLLANPWYVHLDMPRKLACAHRVGMTTSFMNILAPAPAPQPVCEHHSRSCQDLAGVSRHLSGTPGYGDNAHDSDTRSAYRRPPIVCTLSRHMLRSSLTGSVAAVDHGTTSFARRWGSARRLTALRGSCGSRCSAGEGFRPSRKKTMMTTPQMKTKEAKMLHSKIKMDRRMKMSKMGLLLRCKLHGSSGK